MVVKQQKLTVKKAIDYVKFFIAIVLLYVTFLLWQSYDIVIIPIENAQMSPTFEPKEFYIGKRFENWDNLTYNMVVYYDYPHYKAKGRKDCFFFARIAGLPGDMIAIKDGKLYRNGRIVDEPYTAKENLENENFGEVMVPRDHVYLLVDHRKRYNKDIFYKDSRFLGPLLVYTVKGEIKAKGG